MQLLVVGGGIAGLAVAVAAMQRGIAVDVMERESRLIASGAGITLYPNGERALHALGLDAAVADAGERIMTVRTMTPDGRVVAEQPAERWDGIGGTISIHRIALLNVLAEAASGARVRFGTTVSDLNDEGSTMTASFTDGTSGHYDVVVGADGIRSAVRRQVFGDIAVQTVGQMYWRTAVRASIVEEATMVFDADRYVALMPLGDGWTYIAVQKRSARLVAVARTDRLASLRAACDGLGGPVPEALDAIGDGDDIFVGPAEEVSRDTWRSGRVVLVGDAAQTLSPVLTQGGSLALEDAVVLADELAGAGDVDDALGRFVARREPRVRLVREHTTQRIELLNSGADQIDLAAATRATNAILREPI
jgi:2-polyprenyl-6-methoxyphenol hydroxylase-like FAD-dependent oxidoreductase